MKGKDSYENKGYAFVTFRTKELATKAIKELNNKELKVRLKQELDISSATVYVSRYLVKFHSGLM